MTDLNYSIEGKTAEEIAGYFGFNVLLVERAIESGCMTYQDVYDFCKSEMKK